MEAISAACGRTTLLCSFLFVMTLLLVAANVLYIEGAILMTGASTSFVGFQILATIVAVVIVVPVYFWRDVEGRRELVNIAAWQALLWVVLSLFLYGLLRHLGESGFERHSRETGSGLFEVLKEGH